MDSNAFVAAIKTCISKYVGFDGRASRSEFWYWYLFTVVVSIILSILASVASIFGILSGLASLALLLPGLSVSVRRLHDVDKSGWWLLIAFVPIAGLVLLYWWCIRGTVGDNQFGADPLA